MADMEKIIITQSVYMSKTESIGILFAMLMERLNEENTNISHKKMPTWQEHIDFINNKPYKDWFLIFDFQSNELIGQYYITNNNEIGIYIIKRHRRNGYADIIMSKILESNVIDNIEYLANINPKNEASIKFFEKWGFKHIQNTYKRNVNS